MNDRRFNAAQARRLDDPARLLWLPPDEIIAALHLRPGDTISDIGEGTGYFSVPLAQAAGPSGKVYAVDAQEEMLVWLRQKLAESGLSNVEAMQAEADCTGLPDASCGMVFLANVWHEFANRSAILRESSRILKAGGRIAILDWRPDVEPQAGPPLEHRLSASGAGGELRSAGFQHVANVNVGRYSWLVQGEKMQ